MNEPQDTPITVTSGSPYRVESVYSNNGDIIPVDWSYIILSEFPWLSFLTEDDTLIIESDVHVFGLENSEDKFHIPIDTIDSLGFYMIDESASIQFKQQAYEADWNKLPPSLSWLYLDRPYMTSSDMNSILLELKDAIQIGAASAELTSYIETHTYKKPIKTQAYNSYGIYFDNDMLEPHGKLSKVLMKLGFAAKDIKRELAFIYDQDEIIINNDSTLLEIIIQQRIGRYISAQVIYLDSKTNPPHIINLTADDTLKFSDTLLDTTQRFQLDLMLLYNVSQQFPLWCDRNVVYTDREVPLRILTSESGIVGTSSIELRTESTVMPTMTEIGPLSTKYLMFDNEIIQVDTVDNEIIYSEYIVTRM